MRREVRAAFLFISPAIVYFLLFWIAPVVLAVFYSLTNWSVGRAAGFVGLKNYANLFSDPRFHQSLKASAEIVFITVTASTIIALTLAVLLNDDTLRGARLIRLCIILPVVTDWVATGMVWQLIFLPNAGVLASIGAGLHMKALVTTRWISSSALAPWAVSVFIVWKTTGLYAIIFLAGLKGIPLQLKEAARVDGANNWRVFWLIVMPLMRPITVFVIVIAFVTNIGLFEPIFMLTGGGPADATRTLPLFLYENFFLFQRGGYASAAGILFLAITLGFALIAARMLQYSYMED